jgi:proline iminopeptidase
MEAHVNGTRLFYTRIGSGRLLLVMHGGLGWDHTYLRPSLDALGGQATVIYYDHRGNGRSAAPDDWTSVDHATWTGDADALRDHLGDERIVLFGHSYGGFLALEYALRYPDRLDGLILCTTGPAFAHQEVAIANAQERGTPDQVQTLFDLLSRPVAQTSDLRSGIKAILPIYFHDPDEAPLDRITDEMTFCVQAFNRASFHCLPHYDVRDRLSEIDVPALVLGGRDDWIMPPAHSVEPLGASLPNAEATIFERSGHFPFIEERPLFAEVVTDWLYRLPERNRRR